jgi:hypothetical protein
MLYKNNKVSYAEHTLFKGCFCFLKKNLVKSNSLSWFKLLFNCFKVNFFSKDLESAALIEAADLQKK